MIPEEVFKRRPRHNNTPESILLIIANFIVVAVAESLFVNKHHVSWFFWVVTGLLAVYNFFTIRKYREGFNKLTVISYVLSVAILIAVFFFMI
jgi:nicotinamide riboside transporter PnuC